MKLNIDRIVCIGTYMKSNIMMFFLMQIQSGILNALETWDTICTAGHRLHRSFFLLKILYAPKSFNTIFYSNLIYSLELDAMVMWNELNSF